LGSGGEKKTEDPSTLALGGKGAKKTKDGGLRIELTVGGKRINDGSPCRLNPSERKKKGGKHALQTFPEEKELRETRFLSETRAGQERERQGFIAKVEEGGQGGKKDEVTVSYLVGTSTQEISRIKGRG